MDEKCCNKFIKVLIWMFSISVITAVSVYFITLAIGFQKIDRYVDRITESLDNLYSQESRSNSDTTLIPNVGPSDFYNNYTVDVWPESQAELEQRQVEMKERQKEIDDMKQQLDNKSVGLKLIEAVIQIEGEYANVEHDPGGKTLWGISKEKNSGWIPESYEHAVEFYYETYWIGQKLYKLNNQDLAFVLLDSMVLFGINRVRNITVRITGADTYDDAIVELSKLKYSEKDKKEIRKFIDKLKDELRLVVNELVSKNPNLKKFVNGWNNRINSY